MITTFKYCMRWSDFNGFSIVESTAAAVAFSPNIDTVSLIPTMIHCYCLNPISFRYILYSMSIVDARAPSTLESGRQTNETYRAMRSQFVVYISMANARDDKVCDPKIMFVSDTPAYPRNVQILWNSQIILPPQFVHIPKSICSTIQTRSNGMIGGKGRRRLAGCCAHGFHARLNRNEISKFRNFY